MGNLFVAGRDNATAGSRTVLLIDEVIRHDSSNYELTVGGTGDQDVASHSYELRLKIERGGPPRSPAPQTVFLDFRGGVLSLPNASMFTIGPFDAGEIDASYTGRTSTVKQWIAHTTRQNYARFNLTVLNSDEDLPPANGVYSSVYFGGADPGALGLAINGVDPYNQDPTDDAVVFTGRFTPALFTEAPDAKALGIAIGNIASHEIGHMLGLCHVNDKRDLMNTYDAPDYLLTDQRFRSSYVGIEQSLTTELSLSQNAPLLLADTVGLAPSAAVEIRVGAAPEAVIPADYDGDGDIDVTVSCYTAGQIWVIWNEGGKYAEGVVFAAGEFSPWAAAAGDFDNDGKIDLAVADPLRGLISILRNEGTRTFSRPTSLALHRTDPVALIAADLDGNGGMDLALAFQGTSDVSALLNDGHGGFGNENILTATTTVTSVPDTVFAADLDLDGDTDLVHGNTGQADGTIGIDLLLNNGSGGFTSQAVAPAGLVCLIAAEVNQDQMPDLIAIVPTETYEWGAAVLTNTGSGAFLYSGLYQTADIPVALAAGDLDGDSDTDLVVANMDAYSNATLGDISVLINAGNGVFEHEWPCRVSNSPRNEKTVQGPAGVVLADMDGDGDLDVITANRTAGTVSILMNNGDATFGSDDVLRQ